MPLLQNDPIFPHIEISAVGGSIIGRPRDRAGTFGVILIYHGHWCPFCNEHIAAFSGATEALAAHEGLAHVRRAATFIWNPM